MSPKKTLLPEFDGLREEAEHCDKDRQLQKHWYAPSERTYTCFLVQPHHLLLKFHRLFFKPVLYLLHFRFEDLHLGLRYIALVSKRCEYKFDHKCQYKNDQPVIPV